jgi:hypothetical protein
METSDGEARRFHHGDIVLVEDTTGKGHVTSTEDDDAIVAPRAVVEAPRLSGPARSISESTLTHVGNPRQGL